MNYNASSITSPVFFSKSNMSFPKNAIFIGTSRPGIYGGATSDL
jgi:hypothetical protein